jgi:ATP-dependent Lhr-like helicase
MRGLIDFGRIEEMLDRTDARVDHVITDRVTPFAAPLFLEAGRVPVEGAGREALIQAEAEALMREAGLA